LKKGETGYPLMPIDVDFNPYERELIKACQRNERKAQYEFYKLYSSKLMGIAYRFTADKDLANDLLQEAFIRIFTKINDYRFEGPVGAWMRRIDIHASIDFLKKYKKIEFDDIENAPSSKIIEQADQMEKLNCEDIIQEICLLPNGFRTILNLYAIEGYSYPEIAAMLDIKEVTVRSQYMRAKQKLAEALKEKQIIPYVSKSI